MKKLDSYLIEQMDKASDDAMISIGIDLAGLSQEEEEAILPPEPDINSDLTMEEVNAYISEKRAILREVYSAITSAFVEKYLDENDTIRFRGKYIAHVICKVPKAKVLALAALDEVTQIVWVSSYTSVSPMPMWPNLPTDFDYKFTDALKEYAQEVPDEEIIPVLFEIRDPDRELIEKSVAMTIPKPGEDASQEEIDAFNAAVLKMWRENIAERTGSFVKYYLEETETVYYKGIDTVIVICEVAKSRLQYLAALREVLQIDLAGVPEDAPSPEAVSFDALLRAIAEAEKLDMNDYTGVSADAVYSALFDARAALASDSQEEVDTAAQTLNDAVAALVVRRVLDFTEVNELAARVDAVNRDRSRYTEESLKEFDRLCMKTSIDDLEMDEEQEDIDYAAQCLRDALAALVEKHVHEYAAVVTVPTCTAAGYTTHTCDCGDSYVDSEVPALGHSFGAWTASKAATCTDKGEETRACARCDAKETRELAALGHDYKAAVTAPTCTAAGFTTHTCSRCGDKYTDSTTVALGHSFGAWAVSKASTCTEKGQETRTCARCDAKETREIGTLGHNFKDGV